MGQVLGFSHCQEYGSVSSTPDSTPPCTDGGNEESELYELQTAREWSEDEEVGEGDEDDDETLASSPSIWSTPRQNSFELTFSYIAIAEAEAAGASRHLRDRRRGGSRTSRTPIIRTDTLETLLDSPDVEWDPQAFLNQEEEEEEARREREREEEEDRRVREARRREIQTETVTVQRSLQDTELETQERDPGIQREEMESSEPQPPHPSLSLQPPQPPQPPHPSLSLQLPQPLHPSLSLQHHSPSHSLQAAAEALPPSEPESPVTMETISVKLLTSVRTRGGLKGDTSFASSSAIGRNTQEQLVSEHWFSALSLTEDPTVCIHIAGLRTADRAGVAKNGSEGQRDRKREGVNVGAATKMASKAMDLIYWKDAERTGMVLTGIVVGLLSLFQLSIISVVSTLSLAIMCFTISVRIYYNFLHILKWGDGQHPFKAYLDLDIGLSGEQADHYMQKTIVMIVAAINTLKRLIFVASLFDSLKFLALAYLVTFLGNLCNGLTLLIIGVIALFSLPLLYRQRQEQLEGFIANIYAHIDNIKDILQRLAQGGGPPHDPTPGGAKPQSQ